MKVYNIIDTFNVFTDSSKDYYSYHEAYSDLLELQKLFGTIRFYIREKTHS